jgi:glycylpeptide N-tetradecanoyltransferase
MEGEKSADTETQVWVNGLVAHCDRPDEERQYWKVGEHLVAAMSDIYEGKLSEVCRPVYTPGTEEGDDRKWGFLVGAERWALPPGFEWCTVNIDSDEDLNEVYELLKDHYIEAVGVLRFHLSPAVIRWILSVPGYLTDWHLGVRRNDTRALVSFIAASPASMRVHVYTMPAVIINLLCVHHDHRASGLVQLLVKEITRRVSRLGVYQAVYTAEQVLSKPVSVAYFFHRTLNTQKLVDIGWIKMQPTDRVNQQIIKYRLPDRTPLDLSPMTREDLPTAHALLRFYLKKKKLVRLFSLEEFEHSFLPQPGVVDTFVLRSSSGEVTDLCSYILAPMTLTHSRKHKNMLVAYSYYNVASTVSLVDLVGSALVLARNRGADVYNMMDVMDNAEVFKPLLFDEGTGSLSYYLYNYLCPAIVPDDVGLVFI